MLKDILLLIAGAILGGPVGLFFSTYFQRGLESSVDRRRRRRRARSLNRHGLQAGDNVHIAGFATMVHIAEGDGKLILASRNITIRMNRPKPSLPEIVRKSRTRTIRRLAVERRGATGAAPTWNSDTLVALYKYKLSRTGPDEEIAIDLAVGPTDYATFAATVLSLDEPLECVGSDGVAGQASLRSIYFPHEAASREALIKPIPFLANGIGVSLLLFTDDGQVILTRRRPTARARPNERDVSVTEGLHSELDRSESTSLDVYACAARGCEEELGVRVAIHDIQILAFAVDLQYYQWNFIGLVEAPYSAAEILELHALHARDRWESHLEAVPADPGAVFQRFRQDGVWDLGLVTAYLSFCYRTSPRHVRNSARDAFRGSHEYAPWRGR